jgi:hypothetical protein
MQKYSKPEQASQERVLASTAMIKLAIHDRGCLSGSHQAFRVRFAPHALGRDGKGRHIVFAFEYGGLTLGKPHWMWFPVNRLRGLQRNADPWCTGSPERRPPLDLSEIEAAVDACSPAHRTDRP